MLTDRQRDPELRRGRIGCSEIPAILGLSPYQTPGDVWAIKTGRASGPETNSAMMIGDAVEPFLLDYARRELGLKIVAATVQYRCRSLPMVYASVDGMVGSSRRGSPIVECKASSVPWDDGPPDHVDAQVRAQMMTTESDYAYVVKLGPRATEVSIHRISRESSWEDWAGPIISAFWKDVQDGVEPDINRFLGVSHAIAAQARPTAKVAELPADLCARYHELKQRSAEIEHEIRSLRDRIALYMIDSKKGYAPGWSVSYGGQVRRSLDVKRIRSEMPDVADKYSVETTTRSLRVTPKPTEGHQDGQ